MLAVSTECVATEVLQKWCNVKAVHFSPDATPI